MRKEINEEIRRKGKKKIRTQWKKYGMKELRKRETEEG
jgi:hypothetical protein